MTEVEINLIDLINAKFDLVNEKLNVLTDDVKEIKENCKERHLACGGVLRECDSRLDILEQAKATYNSHYEQNREGARRKLDKFQIAAQALSGILGVGAGLLFAYVFGV